ncbi:TPA: hypothetical protein ACUNF5_007291 [Burkholderia orbicola]
MAAAMIVEASDDIEAAMREYADLYRRTRLAGGYIDMNLDQVVAYAVVDMRNTLKHYGGDPLCLLRDEVAYQKECLERLETAKSAEE